MKTEILSRQPLVVLISDDEAKKLPTLDAGAAFTAFLHSQGGKFEQKPLGKYVELVRESVNPSQPRYRDQTFEYIDLAEVDEIFGQILLTRKVKANEIGSSKFRFRTGDFLFARIMPSLANKKVAYVFQAVTNAVASTEFFVLRLKPDAEINPYYLFRALRCDHFTEQAVANVTGATGRQRIAPDTLLSLKVLEAPTELQNEIGESVEREFRLRALAAEKTAQVDDLTLPTLGPTSPRTARPTRRARRRSQ